MLDDISLNLKQAASLVLFAFLMTMFAATATANHDTYQAAEAVENHPDVEMGELQRVDTTKRVVDRIKDTIGLLAFTSGPDTVEPGSTHEFAPEVTLTETIDVEGKVKIIEFYRCADSTCDSPGDEHIDTVRDHIGWSGTEEEGTDWWWSVDYTVPSEGGYYEAAAYICDPDQGTSEECPLVSTDQHHQFEVQSSDDTSVEADPTLYKSPSFEVTDDGRVIGELGIRNQGNGDMPDSDIVEMQVRPEGSGLLSWTSEYSQTCDSDHPENVHKEYQVDAGDSVNIQLQTGSVLEEGEDYTVYFLTREDCYPDNDKTEPIYNSYDAGSFTYGDTTEDTDSSEPEVVEYRSPSVTAENGQVTGTVYFENTGAAMNDSNIIEMQVRPRGEGPLSVVSNTVDLCDTSHPENVHKEFQLDSGEKAEISLPTSAVEPGRTYDIYFLTRSECGGDRVDPYPNSESRIAVEMQDDGTGKIDDTDGLPLLPIGAGLVVAAAVGFAVMRFA